MNEKVRSIRLHEITLALHEPVELLSAKVQKKLGVSPEDILSLDIVRESVDARKAPVFKYSLDVLLEERAFRFAKKRGFSETPMVIQPSFIMGSKEIRGRAVVVGMGPAGLFAALELLNMGYKPLVIERGDDMKNRISAVEKLAQTGELDPESNVCFGMGGAGTFSDGKLTSRSKDARVLQVLETFVRFGAGKSILYSSLPHVGTDVMRKVVHRMGEEIERLGGELRFRTKLSDMEIKDGKLTGIWTQSDAKREFIATNACIVAVGHSARDTVDMFERVGITVTPKAFAMGVRVEHPRELADKNQYGKYAGHERLGSASYKLRAAWQDRGVYSFCMCPGGEIVCSATEPHGTAVNGCSFAARDMEFSNGAIVVSIRPEDFAHTTGRDFQRTYERIAYERAGGNGAIVQRISDFMQDTASGGDIRTSYAPYTVSGNISPCLPEFLPGALRSGFSHFKNVFKDFIEQGNIVGIETRTSSPHRILRDCIEGFYPAGEGAGYSGGIVSSAIDGIKSARELMSHYSNNNVKV